MAQENNNFKPLKEVVSQIKAISKKYNVPIDDLKKRFYEIYNQPYMSQFTDEPHDLHFPADEETGEPEKVVHVKGGERQKHTVRILLAKISAAHDRKNFAGSTTPVVIRVEGKEPITSFKRQQTGEESYRSTLYVTVKDDGKVGFGQLTLWGDANELHPSLIVGQTYKTSVVIGQREPYNMSINNPEDLEDSDEELPPLAEIISKYYDPIEIREMEFNISRDWNDLKLVQGTVTGSWMKITKNNTNMGFLKIIGDDPDEQTVVKFSRSPDQVNMYGEGSFVYCLGQITAATLNENGEERYPVGMWGNLVVPVMLVPVDSDEIGEDDQGFVEEKEVTNDDIAEELDSW